MALSDKNLVSLVAAEHIGPTETGDNIDAKKVAMYTFDPVTSQWNRMGPNAGIVTAAYDYVGFTNADSNGNYQTITFKSGGSGGTTVATVSVTYDANSLITSVTKT